MDIGSIVILHLSNPGEKYWGVIESLTSIGATLHGLNLSSFQDWVHSVVSEDPPSMGLVTVFFPIHRIESMYLDQEVGAAESLRSSFERRVGRSVEAYLMPAQS
jgi:hypothetical protein